MSKTTLVLGASLKPERYSNVAIHKLRNNNYEAVAFGMKSGRVSDVDIDTELKPYNNIDTVTLYLNPQRQRMYFDYILGLKPRRVIFNPGTENLEFYELLRKNDIEFEVACTLVLLSTKQY